MTCPECKQRLTLKQYAWTHRHPSPELRFLGAAMIFSGLVQAGVATGYLWH